MKAVCAVVLPGLDGTGRLLDRFACALGEHFYVQITDYPPDEPWGYDQLLNFVLARLPSKPFILIGESFSGPLALRIAANPPPCLLGVVLGASFARIEGGAWGAALRLAAAASALAPESRFLKNAAVSVLCPFLLGRWMTPAVRRQLQEAVAPVSMRVLAVRAREAVRVDMAKAGTPPLRPVLHLRATEDRLIPSSAARLVETLSERVKVVDVEGPHFLFQAAPEECAYAIGEFACELMRSV